MTGSLNVLNVGAGDIKVVWNKEDKAEAKKAVQMLTDMRSRGYVIAVEMPDGTYERAVDVNPKAGRYILLLPDEVAAKLPERLEAEQVTCACGCGGRVTPGKKWIRGHHHRKPGTYKVSVPAAKVRATGIARSAGG